LYYWYVVHAIVDEFGAEYLTLGLELLDQLRNQFGALVKHLYLGMDGFVPLVLISFLLDGIVQSVAERILVTFNNSVIQVLQISFPYFYGLEYFHELSTIVQEELQANEDLQGLLRIDSVQTVENSGEHILNTQLLHHNF